MTGETKTVRKGRVGKVSLVGAGPGDPGLMTLAALDRVKKADLVIYDRLVSDEVLELIPARIRRVDAGRAFGPSGGAARKKLNELMLREARAGKKVVRLKGGDALLFSRGAEEAQLLRRHRIPYEIVPGVTSALAVPAYAGIPLTHREHSSSVTLVTGREAGERSRIDWTTIARGSDVVVILMGAARTREIARALIGGGRRQGTPLAAIMRGTTKKQNTVVTTLGEAAKKGAEGLGVEPPAVIVVGDVVSLREKLRWRADSGTKMNLAH